MLMNSIGMSSPPAEFPNGPQTWAVPQTTAHLRWSHLRSNRATGFAGAVLCRGQDSGDYWESIRLEAIAHAFQSIHGDCVFLHRLSYQEPPLAIDRRASGFAIACEKAQHACPLTRNAERVKQIDILHDGSAERSLQHRLYEYVTIADLDS